MTDFDAFRLLDETPYTAFPPVSPQWSNQQVISSKISYNVHLLAFEGLLPAPHNEIVMDLLSSLATWDVLAKLRIHTDDTVTLLEDATTAMGTATLYGASRILLVRLTSHGKSTRTRSTKSLWGGDAGFEDKGGEKESGPPNRNEESKR